MELVFGKGEDIYGDRSIHPHRKEVAHQIQVYLDSFESDTMDEMNQKLLGE